VHGCREQYEAYLILTRDGVQARRRNLDEVRASEEANKPSVSYTVICNRCANISQQ
jgi:hypothetical protein